MAKTRQFRIPRIRIPRFEHLETRLALATSVWQNVLHSFDIDHDGRANAIDRSLLSNFLAEHATQGRQVSVPASPNPDAKGVSYLDADGSRIVDDLDLAEVTAFLVGRQPANGAAFGPQASPKPQTANGNANEGEGEGPVPSVWLTTAAGDLVEGDPAQNGFMLTRSTEPAGSLTVHFTLGGTASPGDYESTILASGSVSFPADVFEIYIPVAATEDAILENMEELQVVLTANSAYQIASGAAYTNLHDGEHGVIDTDFSVQWEETPDVWRPADANETLWEGVAHRWRANIPQSLVGNVQSILWYRRPAGNPLATWEEFAGRTFSPQTVEYVVPGFPGVGYWNIMYRATYGTLSWFQSLFKQRAGNDISATYWTKGYDDQRFEEGMFPEGPSARVFPERRDPFDWNGDQNKVKIHVTLREVIPPGFHGQVKLRILDPDHPHTPSVGEDFWVPTTPFDPNDTFYADPEVPELHVRPADNRVAGSGLGLGASLSEVVLDFHPAEQSKFTFMHIDAPQPGNNFLGVSYPKKRHETFNWTDFVWFELDGVTPTLTLPHIRVPEAYRTKMLNVWRTLWVERDSMDLPLGGAFNATDPDPGDLGNVPIDLLAANFLPAQIDVRLVAEGFAVPADDIKDDRFFYHYLEDAPAVIGGVAGSQSAADVRDIATSADLWVIHLINGYEDRRNNDFDDETANNLGLSISGSNTAYIFSETIRDRAEGQDGVPASVEQARLIKRVVLHEAGHLMGAVHGTLPVDGIMDPEGAKVWQDDAKAVFTIKHFGIFQWKHNPSFP